ncbi:TPA: hypothetical protein JHW84_002856 [Escherichia coli]|nr:hypothetical protein [Escherichia coli]
MSNIDKLKSAAAKAVDNFDPNMFVETRDVLALLDELEESERLRLKFQEANCELCQKLEAAEKRIADYQELINGLVGVSSSILREVERINNAAAAGKGE